MKRGLLSITFFCFCLYVTAANSTVVENEEKYYSWRKQILRGEMAKQGANTQEEKKRYVDAVWDEFDLGEGRTSIESLEVLRQLLKSDWNIEERLRLEILGIRFLGHQEATERFREEFDALDEYSKRLRLLIITHQEEASKMISNDVLTEIVKSIELPEFRNKTNQELQDLYNFEPNLVSYRGGEYSRSVKLFVFCRKIRLHPCMMLMKDIYNNPVYLPDGETLWHQQALGSSRRGIPYHTVNGDTPSGIQTIDSVMPEANRPLAFGKFRRVILSFVPSTPEDVDSTFLLPDSAQEYQWWNQASIARDVGRNHIRIHGTGRINEDSTTPFYPLRQTSGCISQKEGIYGEIDYIEQRVLLDNLMMAMELDPIFDNELQIKGLLYLIEINDKEEAVGYDELLDKLESTSS